MSKLIAALTETISQQPIDVHFGTSTSQAAQTTTTLTSFTASSDDAFRGFFASGERAAHIEVLVNDTTRYTARIGGSTFSTHLILPGPDTLSSNDTIKLQITNTTSTNKSADYEGGILIE